MTLSVEQATQLIKEQLQEGGFDCTSEKVQGYLAHLQRTAQLAQKVAIELNKRNPQHRLDTDQIYVAGLLHDIGRFPEKRGVERYHGLLGYEMLKEKDDVAARTALTHMLRWNYIPPFEKCDEYAALFHGNREDYNQVVQLMNSQKRTEADLLIQLADALNNRDGYVMASERVTEYQKRHQAYLCSHHNHLCGLLVAYFDAKLGHSVYDFFEELTNNPIEPFKALSTSSNKPSPKSKISTPEGR